MALDHTLHVFNVHRFLTFERTTFLLTFKTQLKKKKLFNAPFACNLKFKTCLKFCILALNFVSDFAQVG